MLAAYMSHEIDMSSLLQRLLKNLAMAIATIMSGKEPEVRMKLFAELTVVPYFLSRGKNPRLLLEGCPTPVPIDAGALAYIESTFKKWGAEIVDDDGSI